MRKYSVECVKQPEYAQVRHGAGRRRVLGRILSRSHTPPPPVQLTRERASTRP